MSDESDNRLVTTSNAPLSLAEREELAILLSPWTIRASKDLERLAYLSARCEPAADASLLQALLAQYNTLRLESQNSINNRIIVLSYGLVALGTLAGGASAIQGLSERAAANASALVFHLTFCGAIPLVAVCVLMIWLSEALRSSRVGSFLAADVEPQINQHL